MMWLGVKLVAQPCAVLGTVWHCCCPLHEYDGNTPVAILLQSCVATVARISHEMLQLSHAVLMHLLWAVGASCYF